MSENDKAPVLVGVDGSEASVDALRYAARLAGALNASLRIVTVWEHSRLMPYSPLDAWDLQREAGEKLSTSVEHAFGGSVPKATVAEVLEGSPAVTLLEESKHARMLVLGTKGAGGFARILLGSVSAACAEHAQCPVLLVPARGRDGDHHGVASGKLHAHPVHVRA